MLKSITPPATLLICVVGGVIVVVKLCVYKKLFKICRIRTNFKNNVKIIDSDYI